MRPGWAGVHAERVEAFTTRAWWLRRSRSGSESPAPSSIREAVAAMRAASGWPWFLTAAPDSLGGFVKSVVAPGARIITDDWSGYAGLTKHGYDHVSVAERGDPQVAEEFMPIIHLVFSNLKTWLRGIHHGVSPQHLQAYLNEFTFRFNRRFYPFNAFRSLLGIAGDVTAPTYARALRRKIANHYI